MRGSRGYVQDLLARADAAHVVIELDAACRNVQLALLNALLLVAFVLLRALRCSHTLLSVPCVLTRKERRRCHKDRGVLCSHSSGVLLRNAQASV